MSYGSFITLSAAPHKLESRLAADIPNWKRTTLLGYSLSGVIRGIGRLMAQKSLVSGSGSR
jgi:hypothetical protein